MARVAVIGGTDEQRDWAMKHQVSQGGVSAPPEFSGPDLVRGLDVVTRCGGSDTSLKPGASDTTGLSTTLRAAASVSVSDVEGAGGA